MRRWGILWLGLALGLSLALGSGGHMAWAASEPAHAPAKLVLPRPDPPGHWRTMTLDPATTTSKCVGQVTTAMCAIDTIEACLVRLDDNLCRIGLGLDKLPGLVDNDFPPIKSEYFKYRVLWAGRKPTGHLTPRQEAFYRNWTDTWGSRSPQYPWPPGDVKIRVLVIDCIYGYCEPRSLQMPTDYLLEKAQMVGRCLTGIRNALRQTSLRRRAIEFFDDDFIDDGESGRIRRDLCRV